MKPQDETAPAELREEMARVECFASHVDQMHHAWEDERKRRLKYLGRVMAVTDSPEYPRVLLDLPIKMRVDSREITVEDGIVCQLVDDDIAEFLLSKRLTREQSLLLHLLRQKDSSYVPRLTPAIAVDEHGHEETVSG